MFILYYLIIIHPKTPYAWENNRNNILHFI